MTELFCFVPTSSEHRSRRSTALTNEMPDVTVPWSVRSPVQRTKERTHRQTRRRTHRRTRRPTAYTRANSPADSPAHLSLVTSLAHGFDQSSEIKRVKTQRHKLSSTYTPRGIKSKLSKIRIVCRSSRRRHGITNIKLGVRVKSYITINEHSASVHSVGCNISCSASRQFLSRGNTICSCGEFDGVSHWSLHKSFSLHITATTIFIEVYFQSKGSLPVCRWKRSILRKKYINCRVS